MCNFGTGRSRQHIGQVYFSVQLSQTYLDDIMALTRKYSNASNVVHTYVRTIHATLYKLFSSYKDCLLAMDQLYTGRNLAQCFI